MPPTPEWLRAVDPFANAALLYYPRLQRVEQYIQDRGFKGIKLTDVARIAGLETKYFSAYFHSKVGIRFRDWIRALRVERAKQLIRNQYSGIAGVAFAAGFSDVRSFERAFKLVVGSTPIEWRAAVQIHLRRSTSLS